MQLNMKNKQLNKKWAKALNRHFFPKENIQVDNQHMEGWSVSLIPREMQTKMA